MEHGTAQVINVAESNNLQTREWTAEQRRAAFLVAKRKLEAEDALKSDRD